MKKHLKPARSGDFRQHLTTILCVIFVSAGVTGCASRYDDWESSGPLDSRETGNFAADSSLGAQLSRVDRSILAETMSRALGERSNTPVSWTGEDSSGLIEGGDFLLANVLPDPQEVLPTHPDVMLTYKLETEQGDYVLLKNSNIRLGPSTENAIAETLSAGIGVEGIGLVQGEPWMLIAYQDRVRGYVFKSLIEKAPGTERLELVGGPLRQPYLCREFTQSLNVRGQKDRWQGMACDFGNGWELAGRTGPTVLGDAF